MVVSSTLPYSYTVNTTDGLDRPKRSGLVTTLQRRTRNLFSTLLGVKTLVLPLLSQLLVDRVVVNKELVRQLVINQ